MIRILTYSKSHSVRNLGFDTTTWLNRNVEYYNRDVIIRWGNNSLAYNRYGGYTEFRNVLNPASAISLNMSKIRAHEVLSSVVNVPKMYRKCTPNYGLFVVRPYVHEGGSGFKVVEANGRSITLNQGSQYATEYINTDREYRVWFVGNKTLRARRANSQDNSRFPCRSRWGYIFCREVPYSLHTQTLKAARSIGLDIGAADVLYKNDTWYFLELNSAPSCDLPILNRWMKNSINQLVEERAF